MLIGIAGLKRSGKDTVADHIVKKYKFQKLTFADPLKQACKVLFNFSDEQLYGNKKEEIDPRWGVSPRKAFQYLGTEIFRNHISTIMPDIKDNFWINLTMDSSKKYENVVISDVRFDNEADAIRKQGGVIIKIVRPSLEKSDDHISENADLSADYVIINNSDIKHLLYRVEYIVDKIHYLKDGKKLITGEHVVGNIFEPVGK